MHKSAYLFLFALAVCMSGCTTVRERAILHAADHGFVRQDISVSPFKLASWQRLTPFTPTLYIYLEGDGYAWANRSRPSADPTPRIPMALMLANRDTAPSVAYLARPCQYTKCRPERDYAYWTSARFAPEVVKATRYAIHTIQKQAKAQQVILIGYSGGGVLAALVAAQDNAIAGLITVASPLDVEAWTRHHELSSLSASEKPLAYAKRLRTVPQLHLVGSKDKIVPTFIIQSYAKTIASPCLHILEIANMNHNGAWAEHWQRPTLPNCQTPIRNTE